MCPHPLHAFFEEKKHPTQIRGGVLIGWQKRLPLRCVYPWRATPEGFQAGCFEVASTTPRTPQNRLCRLSYR
nr:MAG TPA: hypothetical protein [Caudoviricetes sp.]